MKTIKILATVAVSAALISACGDHPVSGTVVGKYYDDPDSWTDMVPQYTSMCTQIGTTTSCTQILIGFTYVDEYDPAHWNIIVKDSKGKNHTFGVRQSLYNQADKGEYYDAKTDSLTGNL